MVCMCFAQPWYLTTFQIPLHSKLYLHYFPYLQVCTRTHSLVCFVLKSATSDEPLRGSLHAAPMDTNSGLHFVAVVFPGRMAVYTLENGTNTTPGANWERNFCCLGEVNKLYVCCYCSVN